MSCQVILSLKPAGKSRRLGSFVDAEITLADAMERAACLPRMYRNKATAMPGIIGIRPAAAKNVAT